ncbi:hypothetical protein SC206_19000 [Rouxiella sp. T17]|uniref:hypothetical protein n=1 Tax=Rouxiella sp. T17 TaxID=3085684 RepID=UPI002FC63811
MSIPAKIIKNLLNENYDFSKFLEGNDDKRMVNSLSVPKLVVLMLTLKRFIPDVRLYQTKQKHEKNRKSVLNQQRLTKLLIDNDFDLQDIESLIISKKEKAKSIIIESANYKVIQYKIFFDEDTFLTLNGKVLPNKLRNNPRFVELLDKKPKYLNVDRFLRDYSPQFLEKYPINAQFLSDTFHCNLKGRLNSEAQFYFEKWQEKNHTVSLPEFKKAVLIGNAM